MEVRCICIDDTNKPDTIPDNQWVVLNKPYTITWIYWHTLQGIQGVELKEINLKGCEPYESYRLTRFAILIEDIPKLIELLKSCTELNDLEIDELIKEHELVPVEDELLKH